MAKGVSLGIFSDTRDFERGIRTGVIDPLEDAQDAVDALGDAAAPAIGDAIATDVGEGVTRATGKLDTLETAVEGVHPTVDVGDAIATDVDQGVDKAQTDLERLETKMREYRTTAKTQSNLAGTDLGTSVHAGAVKVEEGVDGMKESVKGGAREIAGSFDGTMEGVAGGVQGILAEVGEGFGPLGVIVSTGLGLALGGVMAQLTKTQELSDAAKERVGALAGQLIEAGSTGGRSFDDAVQALKDLATETDPAQTSLAELWDSAKAAGQDYQTLVQTVIEGDPAKLAALQARLDGIAAAHGTGASKVAGYRVAAVTAAEKTGDAQRSLADKVGHVADEAKNAARMQRLAAAAGLTEFSLKTDLLNQLADGFQDAAGDVDDYIDKESGLFDVDKYITAMQERADALEDYQETLSKSKLSPEARSFIESQGAEQAAAMMAGYKKATPEQRRQLQGIWTTSGRKSAESYGQALGSDLRDTTVAGPKIKRPFVPAPDMTLVRRALNTLDNKEIAVRIRPKLPNGVNLF